MKALLATLLTAGLVLAAAESQPDKKESDRARLQGTWQVVSMTNSGKEVPQEALKGTHLIFEGASYALKGGDERYRGRYAIDPTKDPKTIDTTYKAVDEKERGIAHGIYKLEGKRLTIAWREGGKERPKGFTSEPGSGVRLLVAEWEK